MSNHKQKKPRNPRCQGIKNRKLAALTLKIQKLKTILNGGKITELEIEKYGFRLEQCESEYQKLSRGQTA